MKEKADHAKVQSNVQKATIARAFVKACSKKNPICPVSETCWFGWTRAPAAREVASKALSERPVSSKSTSRRKSISATQKRVARLPCDSNDSSTTRARRESWIKLVCRYYFYEGESGNAFFFKTTKNITTVRSEL